jgi:hypothetical protein
VKTRPWHRIERLAEQKKPTLGIAGCRRAGKSSGQHHAASREPLYWFFKEVDGKVISGFTADDVLQQGRRPASA